MKKSEKKTRTKSAGFKNDEAHDKPVWHAWIMFDLATGLRIGVYTSRSEADDDCPGWRDEGYVIKPCEIRLVRFTA